MKKSRTSVFWILGGLIALGGCARGSSDSLGSQLPPDEGPPPVKITMTLGGLDGTSDEPITLEVREGESGPLWHVYSVGGGTDEARGLQWSASVWYWRDGRPDGAVHVETSRAPDQEGAEQASHVLYTEEDGSGNGRIVWTATSGTIDLEAVANGYRMTLTDIAFYPGGAYACHHADEVYDEYGSVEVCDWEPVDTDAEPRVMSGEIRGELAWTCLLAGPDPTNPSIPDAPWHEDRDKTSDFCRENAP